MSGNRFQFVFLAITVLLMSHIAPAQTPIERAEFTFSAEHTNALVMRVEAAISLSQAESGLVPEIAAREIAERAQLKYAPLEEIQTEHQRVRHRMVALLNVWRRSLSPAASDALHRGVTTVDIYDTVMILKLLDASSIMLEQLLDLEQGFACLALRYQHTPMIGRTLGQHALPITFGKKAITWAALTRRNIERLHEVRQRLRSAGVLKGAVGTHLGLGEHGIEIEQGVAHRLGLDTPEPADWRATRDVFAEYAQNLALIAKSLSAFGGEVFRLQMTDIGEVYERRPASTVGSSTMPHKRNPSLSEALMHHGRMIPALAMVLLDDVESSFERDNTSRPNRVLGEISVQTTNAIFDAHRLLTRLEVMPDRMRENLEHTDGMIMAQRIVLFLADSMPREVAEQRVKSAAQYSLDHNQSFRASLLEDEQLAARLGDQLDHLLDPSGYIGLAPDQVTQTTAWIDALREATREPPLTKCPADD